MPIVTERLGSSMLMAEAGEGRPDRPACPDGDVPDARHGDDLAGPGFLGVHAVQGLGDVQLAMRAGSLLPSRRHHATIWPRRMVPCTTRHSASRPK